MFDLTLFDDVEVSPVREENGVCQVCRKEDNPHFWGVYLHYDATQRVEGAVGVEHVMDFRTERQANAVGKALKEALTKYLAGESG